MCIAILHRPTCKDAHRSVVPTHLRVQCRLAANGRKSVHVPVSTGLADSALLISRSGSPLAPNTICGRLPPPLASDSASAEVPSAN